MEEPIYMTHTLVRDREFYSNFASCFVDESRELCRLIIDPKGNIRNFPGIETCEALQAEYPEFQGAPQVRHEMRFGPFRDGKILTVWTVRPDGREYMDSWGFGGEDFESVRLYSFLDENGDFTAPFRLYAIGDRLYTGYAFSDDVRRHKERKHGA